MKRVVVVTGITLVVIMGIFSFFKKINEKQALSGQPPWEGRISIYDHIRSSLDETGEKLTKAGDTLPDEKIRFDKAGMKWMSGAMDGAGGHHWGSGGDKETAQKVSDILIKISRKNNLKDKIKLYNILTKQSVLDYIDPALELAVNTGIYPEPYLHSFARFLATRSPDREPVKFGIALLGIIDDKADAEIVSLLGLHEEFTLYSAVALLNLSTNPEKSLWDLAKCVEGWGRIELVERLTKTENPAIKEWLLREGYRNNIMYEYTAYACATTGDLSSAITVDEVDDELLAAAGDIIRALVTGGPAEDINDYVDAAVVVNSYLKLIDPKARSLEHFLIVESIRHYLTDSDWNPNDRIKNGWDETTRKDALDIIREILERPYWSDLAREGLKSKDEQEFFNADKVAGYLGIDTWDIHWQRLHEKPFDSARWFCVVHNIKSDKAPVVVAYAMDILPLEKIATGPANEMGLGKEFELHNCLDSIVQELGKFPGEGWPLIAASLQSPVIRNRNMALRALGEWGQDKWPAEVAPALRAAKSVEPEEDVKKSIQKILAGEKFDPPDFDAEE